MEVYKYNETIKMCRFCLMCRHACTVGNATLNDSNLPRGKALLLFANQMELSEWDDRSVEIVYQCTNCHLCREWCVPGWDIAPVMLAARADLVQLGLDPPAARQVKQNFELSGNLYGEPESQLSDWWASLSLPAAAPVLYYPGCTVSHRQPEMAKAAVRLFQASKTEFTVLNEEHCCGEPLYVLGYREDAKVLAARTMQAIIDSGAKTVVSSSPTCIESFRHGYREWGVPVPDDIQFVHISEFLARLIAAGKLILTQKLDLSLTYHDPCSLGREMRVFDEPRQVIQAVPGIDFREMRLNRNFSPCCGNGGGLPMTDFKTAFKAGENAGAVILETKADVLVTSCPSCKLSLSKHVPGMQVLDIAELLAQAL